MGQCALPESWPRRNDAPTVRAITLAFGEQTHQRRMRSINLGHTAAVGHVRARHIVAVYDNHSDAEQAWIVGSKGPRSSGE